VAHAESFTDLSGHDPLSADPWPEPDFIMLTAIHGKPLSHAVNSLMLVYVFSFFLALYGALLLWRATRDNLTRPLEAVNAGIADGWTRIRTPGDKALRWHEPFALYEHYEKTGDELRANKNELQRLNTALTFAKRAEENRRQMTSNIAHELKTPLAVIHSYAEGLKDRIAEDKREHYLDVILAESERMDAMVMEMLDLSRLEAGKVTLARDEFSLSALVRDLFGKFELIIGEKDLDLDFALQGDCMVYADEARIAQVVSNFAANAVKHAPAGSSILVRTYVQRGETGFSVENVSPPLTREEQGQVWEAFYRTDEARSDKGTGLGLTIAKSIVDLHGGKCTVRNTKTGVELASPFDFTTS